MNRHLSREQMLKYRDRELLPADLVSIDEHLGSCESCRTELAELASPGTATLSAILEARDEHITYEQMDAWVENSMDADERELVMSHVGLCGFCAQQLKAYEGYAQAMAAAIPPPARPVHSFRSRIRAFFWMPQVAMIAAGLAIVAILSPLAMHRTAGHAGVPSALETDGIRDLPQTRDSWLKYPVSEVVEERQPILRWDESTGESTVYLYDAAHHEVAHRDAAADSHWLVPVLLDRGAVYYWEVRTAAGTSQAEFRVLSDSGEKELAAARASHSGLQAIGQMEERLGLLSLAEQDFSIFLKENPSSKDATDRLNHVKRLEGR